MKKFMQYLPHPIIVGFMAAFIPLAQQLSGGYIIAWAAFAACACYFIAGCTIKAGLNVLACWAAGAGAATAIFWSFGELTSGDNPMNATFALCLTTGVVTFFAMFFENGKFLQLIPQWFVGAACLFAFHTIQTKVDVIGAAASANYIPVASYLDSGVRVVASCFVGQAIASVIAVARTRYGKMMEGESTEKSSETSDEPKGTPEAA